MHPLIISKDYGTSYSHDGTLSRKDNFHISEHLERWDKKLQGAGLPETVYPDLTVTTRDADAFIARIGFPGTDHGGVFHTFWWDNLEGLTPADSVIAFFLRATKQFLDDVFGARASIIKARREDYHGKIQADCHITRDGIAVITAGRASLAAYSLTDTQTPHWDNQVIIKKYTTNPNIFTKGN